MRASNVKQVLAPVLYRYSLGEIVKNNIGKFWPLGMLYKRKKICKSN